MLNYLKQLFSQVPRHEYLDLTQHEIEALTFQYNLADAHTHQSQSPSQRRIVERLPKLWYEAEQTTQRELDQRFIEAFFRVRKQLSALKSSPAMLVYAASVALTITANYLAKKRLSVSLVEPCFDNLHDILQHFGVSTAPIKEEWLRDPATIYDELRTHATGDAIFLVDPNNPTGFTLSRHGRKAWKEVVRFAVDHKKLLILDFCFASFMLPDDTLDTFDLHQLLDKSGVSYIAIEDTGKTWPVQDAKVAILKTSQDLYPEIYNIHTSYLLNVSPFILNLLTSYILDSEKDGFRSIYSLLERNREFAKKTLAGSLLEYQPSDAKVSVAWFKISDPTLKATELQKQLYKAGVYVLPGTYFFWSDHSRGDQYIRIALARDTDVFRPAIQLVRQTLDTLTTKR